MTRLSALAARASLAIVLGATGALAAPSQTQMSQSTSPQKMPTQNQAGIMNPTDMAEMKRMVVHMEKVTEDCNRMMKKTQPTTIFS